MDTLPLRRTKLYRPRISGDLVLRPSRPRKDHGGSIGDHAAGRMVDEAALASLLGPLYYLGNPLQAVKKVKETERRHVRKGA